MRVLTWNLERRKIDTSYGKMAAKYLLSHGPDMMVLTETRINFPESGGHNIWSRPSLGRYADDERKVLMWSKNPWADIDDMGDVNLPAGRFISGVTDTHLGKVRIVGICIPYHMANVSHGTKDKKPWQEHIDFLRILPSILDSYSEPLVIAGDFNQRYPRIKNGNKVAAHAMVETFLKYDIVTKGIIKGMSKAGIDHIATDESFQTKSVWGWPSVIEGIRLSDHDGVGCELVSLLVDV